MRFFSAAEKEKYCSFCSLC